MANICSFTLIIAVADSESEIEALKGFTSGLVKDHFAALVPVPEFATYEETCKLWGCNGAFDETLTWEECKLDYSGHCKWSPPIRWARAIATTHPAWNIKFEFASWESGYRGSMIWDGQQWAKEFVDHICMACGRVNCQAPCPGILTKRQLLERNLADEDSFFIFGETEEQKEKQRQKWRAQLAEMDTQP